jgi:transposase
VKAPTTKEVVAKLLLNHHTARDAAAIASVSVSYAQDIRRGLVAEGKVPAAPGRGRPRKEKAS